MATQIVMDHTGDTRTEFKADDAAQVKIAMERFAELVGLGYTPAKRIAPGQVEKLKAFDPAAEETVFFPRLQGG